MEYFKIGDIDFSMYVSSLKVKTAVNYNSQTNAAGDTVVDYINKKRSIEVGIIALNAMTMPTLQDAIAPFNVSITFRNPQTNDLETINCIIPENEIEYYTIQISKVMYKAATLTFTEL